MFPASRVEKAWRLPSAIALGCLALIVAGTAIWWIVSKEMPQPQSASSASIPIPPPAETVHPNIDPVLVGTFELDSVIDGYNWHFIYSISPDGTYRLVTTQEEDGTYRAANGSFWTKGAHTGRVRTGSYRAVGNAAIEVKSSGGTATFRSADPTTTIDQEHPVMLGVWPLPSNRVA